MPSFYGPEAGAAAAAAADADAHNNSGPESLALAFGRSPCHSSFASSSLYGDDAVDGGRSASAGLDETPDDYSHVVHELNATRRQCKEEQERVNDLEDQMNSLSECGGDGIIG